MLDLHFLRDQSEEGKKYTESAMYVAKIQGLWYLEGLFEQHDARPSLQRTSSSAS